MVGRRSSIASVLAGARSSRRARSWRAAALPVALASAMAAAWPTEVHAQPPEDAPFGRGVTTLDLDLSSWGLFDRDVTSLGFGLGSKRYVIDGLALGLNLSDTILIYRDAFKARHPGIDAQLPTNMVELTPLVQYAFFRSRWFSPYVYGGLGPVFFNHGGGTHGQWVAGPGVYIHVRGPIFASLGVAFSGLFPGGRCSDALVYQAEGAAAPGMPVDLCSFRWAPQVGVTLAFGGRGREPRAPRRDAASERPREQPGVPPVDASSTPASATAATNSEPVDPPPPRAAGDAPGAPEADSPAPGNLAPAAPAPVIGPALPPPERQPPVPRSAELVEPEAAR